MLKSKLQILLRSFLFLSVSVFVFSNILFAQSPEEMMKKANEYYQQNNFDKAIEIYKQVEQQGYEGTSLFYNLGNAFYRKGNLGYAILYYEKARRISPGDEDVQHNLNLANSKTIDKIEPMPRFFLFQWWEGLLAFFSVSGWAWFSYIIYILLLFSVAGYFFFRKSQFQRYSFFAGLVTLVLLVISVALVSVKYKREVNIENAIVLQPVVTAKLAPDIDSNDAFVIHEGLKVRVEDKVDNWLKIKLRDGKVGWLSQKDLGTI